MRLVLDTSALWYHPFLEGLAALKSSGLAEQFGVRAVLPSIAYAERLRQLRRDGRDETVWREALQRADIHIEPFTAEEADRVGGPALETDAWYDHARDHLIALHVHGGRTAVTDDAGAPWGHLPTLTARQATRALAELLKEL